MRNRTGHAGSARLWIFQAVLAALLLGLALWQVDLREVGRSLARAQYGWVLLAVLIYALTRVLHTVHWQIYLTKVGRVPFPGLLGAFVIGNFVNNVLPARMGDVATIQIVANRYGLSRAGMVAASGVETILDAVTLAIMAVVAIALLNVAFAPAALLWTMAVLMIVLFVAAVVASRFFERELPGWRWLRAMPDVAEQALRDAWPRLRDGIETLRNERLLAVVVALTVVGYLIEVVLFWAFGQAFGLGLAFTAYVGVTVAVSFVRTFPITFQNIGTYEVVLLGLLAREGASADDAFAYAVATRIFISLSITAMGLLAMWLMRLSPRDVFALRRDDGEAVPAL
jgi:uncharacterized protein (TIRG00374 family)